MGVQEVSIPIAFIAGVLSFFSPCILPLIPVYIMYLTGTTAEAEVNERRLFAVTRTLGFILGFTVIFMIMGLSASFLGQVFAQNRMLLLRISGIVMIIFGLNMIGLFKLSFIKLPTVIKSPKTVTSFFSAFVMGLAFAAGWTPCFGPVLASIVLYAGATSTVGQGVVLLLTYSLGMAIPFLLTALFINTFNKLLDKTEKFIKYVPKISGAILILFGLLILTNKLVQLTTLF
ncbi:MAG: cytochrome c biogenesis protein CcdA [Clostridiales bacterium]|nr:cytochrome c biogenesis protein CcdA [Clostridiales bacterium]